MLWRLRNTISQFVAGRYGSDQLNLFLLVMYMVLWVVMLFVRQPLVGTLLSLVSLALLVVSCWRMLSRNIAGRHAENARFLRWWSGVVRWLRRQRDRLRDVRCWRYRRCPHCRADLRLPIRRGRRTVTCSRCHQPFKAFFL